jgi:hypothetical protein
MIALMMEAVLTFETSVYFYKTTRRHILEGCNVILAAAKTCTERSRSDLGSSGIFDTTVGITVIITI